MLLPGLIFMANAACLMFVLLVLFYAGCIQDKGVSPEH